MAIEAVPGRARPEKRQDRLRLVPQRNQLRRGDRQGRLVNVHRSADGDRTWTCDCVCGWSTNRLRFRHEGAAKHAGELHLQVCRLINP
jgi:hypothetical protein